MVTDLLQLISDVLGGAITGILGFALTVFNTLIWDPTLNTGAGGFTEMFQFLLVMSIVGIVITVAVSFVRRF